MLTIATPPVYSKLATANLPESIGRRLPAGWRLHEHQLETYQALSSSQFDVVINTAMTGDGKSLAGYLPALVDGAPLLALYPTNELARDQELWLDNERRRWGARFSHERVTAAHLDALAQAARLERKGAALEQVLANRDVVLTNPDIFHYVAQFCYLRNGDAPDRLFGRRLVQGYDQFIFDEFHVFDAPQVVAVVNALLLIREVSGAGPAGLGVGRKRFLFLSATPVDLLIEYLNRAGFAVHTVSTAGRYHHGDAPPEPAAWRPILRQTDISFHAGGGAGAAEAWVEAHADDVLLDFFRQRPAAKGAIIVNSVAAAHRIAARLRPLFEAERLTLELNTGLTSEALRQVSRESDLLVGTSTVDVGVDFRINFLVFESRDAATFLQRLGRLGRHDDDGRGHPFDSFQAHALVPDFILERLSPAHLADGGHYSREQLAAAIREVYPDPARFEDYARRWGRFQSVRVLLALARGPVRDTYADARRNLADHYWRTFGVNSNRARQDYKALESTQRPLLEEARSFRGGSPLQCALINQIEPGRPIQRYDLLSLLANADLDWLERDEFEAELVARRLDPPFSLDDPVAFFRLRGFAAARRPLGVRLARPVEEWSPEQWGEPLVLQGVTLDADGLPWLNALNHRLRRRPLVATLCRTPAAELRRRLRLPSLFALYDFLSVDGVTGAIAFARPALLLHTALRRVRYDCGGGAIFL